MTHNNAYYISFNQVILLKCGFCVKIYMMYICIVSYVIHILHLLIYSLENVLIVIAIIYQRKISISSIHFFIIKININSFLIDKLHLYSEI